MLLRWFAALSGAWLLFNLVAMPLAWGGINAEGGGQWWVQLVILLGFVVIFIFDLVSAGMILTRACWLRGDLGGKRCESGWLVVLAALGVVGLAGAKVMVDEIGRETPIGWGVGGGVGHPLYLSRPSARLHPGLPLL